MSTLATVKSSSLQGRELDRSAWVGRIALCHILQENVSQGEIYDICLYKECANGLKKRTKKSAVQVNIHDSIGDDTRFHKLLCHLNK